MACFLAPAAGAIAVTIIQKKLKSKEDKTGQKYPCSEISWSQKLNWLKTLLWGGVFLLAIEHIWHGEVVPWPPFLTAMNNPADIAPMLGEIATVGVCMAVLVTAAWGAMVFLAGRIHQKPPAMKHTPQED
ncbi:MAG: hypothetical protein H6Q61_1159 [Firmicutes bacterium]|nr:hypothetical protein [Bacillota bacterium]